MKEYLKPEAEVVNLAVMDIITGGKIDGGDDDGDMGAESSIW